MCILWTIAAFILGGMLGIVAMALMVMAKRIDASAFDRDGVGPLDRPSGC